MITATICGDDIKGMNGAVYTFASVEVAAKELVKAYPDSLDSIEIYRDGKHVASFI